MIAFTTMPQAYPALIIDAVVTWTRHKGHNMDLPDCCCAANCNVEALNGVVTGDKNWGFPVATTVIVCGEKEGNHSEELSNCYLKQKVKPAGVCEHLQRHPDCCRENKAVAEAAESAHFNQCPQLTELFLKLKKKISIIFSLQFCLTLTNIFQEIQALLSFG